MLKDVLKELRENAHLTKKKVAEAVGITERAYIAYEYGERDVSTETLSKIADFYSVTTDFLLGRSSPAPDPVAQLAAQLGLSPLERAIVASYIAMDAEHRKNLVKLVCELADGTKDEKTQKSATCGEIEEARKSVEEAS